MRTAHVALGYRFTVACTDTHLQAHVDRVFASLASQERLADPDEPADHFTLDTSSSSGPFQLRLDGNVLASSSIPSEPLAHLLHQVNVRAVERADHLTLLHASAACAPSGPVLFPAAMGAGKSTLVTALVRRGWPYVTDEIVALRPTGEVVPYPRAISLDPGSWAMFPALQPDVHPHLEQLLPNQWQVPVPSAGGIMANDPGTPAAVVFPSYTPGRPSALDPITGMDGLRHLLDATFRLDRHPQRDLDVLAAIVTDRPCYRLAVGELWEACRLLETEFDVFETPVAGRVTVSRGDDDRGRTGGRRTQVGRASPPIRREPLPSPASRT